MKAPRLSVLLVAATSALAACVDDTPTMLRVGDDASVSAASAAARHVVTFTAQQGVPDGFSARVEALGGRVALGMPQVGMAVVEGLSAGAAQSLLASSEVVSVAEDQVVELDPVLEAGTVEAVAAAGPASQSDPTTAVRFPYQWHHRAIQAPQAWAQDPSALGSPSVRVAILDSGIDPAWPDLVGLVDHARSRSFVPSDAVPLALFPGAPDYTDMNGHGTHVANTVSSRGNLVAGVTSRTTLIAVKVLGARGSGSSAGVLAGIVYAATPISEGGAGADVINMSLGSSFNRRDASAAGGSGPSFLAEVNRAINYANRQGVTVVVSAGNSAADLDHDGNGYKSYCSAPNVVCVSATGPREGLLSGPNAFIAGFSDFDDLAIYSNFGRSAVNVAGPGGNYTLNAAGTAAISGGFVWQACSSTRTNYSTATATFSKHTCATSPYRIAGYSGTSMASPHVAGLAAILVQRYGRNPGRVRAAIEQSADDLGQPGVDAAYGKGRINVFRAVSR